MSEFRPARRRVKVSVGDSVRIVRGLQELSQNQLAELTGIPQTTISAIENGRVRLGVERAKVLARALKCHPAVLVFTAGNRRAVSLTYDPAVVAFVTPLAELQAVPKGLTQQAARRLRAAADGGR